MERLDLGDSRLPITIFGKDIDLEKPSMKQIFDNESKIKEAGEDASKIAKVMVEFLVDIGMPEEVVEKMNTGQVEQLMNHLRGSKKN